MECGNYEITAAELEPVAQAVVDRAAPLARERVLDLACGTGDAALPAAAAGASQDHPMALAAPPVLERAGAEAEAREAMIAVLREGNEDLDGFLVHSRYVVHELRAG